MVGNRLIIKQTTPSSPQPDNIGTAQTMHTRMSLLLKSEHRSGQTQHHLHDTDDKYPFPNQLIHLTNRKRKVSVHPLQCICNKCVERRNKESIHISLGGSKSDNQHPGQGAPSSNTTDPSVSCFPVSMSPSLYARNPKLSHCPSHPSRPKAAHASSGIHESGIKLQLYGRNNQSSMSSSNTSPSGSPPQSARRNGRIRRWFQNWFRTSSPDYQPSSV